MVIRKLFDQVRSYYLGKTTSLRLNAYDDAVISGEILRYLKTRQMPDGPEPVCQRAAALIRQTEQDALTDHRLAMQAYCQFMINAYGDIMEALALERLFRLDVAFADPGFAHYERGPVDLLFWVAPVFERDISGVLAWVREKTGFALKLTYEEIVHEVLRVQSANIAANHVTHDLLMSGAPTENPKVKKLRHLANTLWHPEVLLTSAAKTQVEMANWDRLGKLLLHLRLGVGRK